MHNYHRHHIIPSYMGGSDEPSNIVILTIEEHAQAHRILFEQHGNLEDYLAWKGLEGSISKSEYIYLRCKIGGYKSKGRVKSLEEKQKLSNSWTEERKKKNGILAKKRFTNVPKSASHIEKMKKRIVPVEQIEKGRQTQLKNNYGGKKISTPMGIFQSLKDCSRKTGINNRTLKYRAQNKIMGYSFIMENS